MRLINLNYLNRLRLTDKGNGWKPFPGEYPTRIAWKIGWDAGYNLPKGMRHAYTYIGKPNKLAIQRWTALATQGMELQAPATMLIMEFDRDHILSRSQGVWQNQWQHRGSPLLFSAYHPFIGHNWIPDVWNTKLHTKNIGGFRCYWQQPVLQAEIVKQYKEWFLEHCGKQLRGKLDKADELPPVKSAEQIAREAADRALGRLEARRIARERDRLRAAQPLFPGRVGWEPAPGEIVERPVPPPPQFEVNQREVEELFLDLEDGEGRDR